MGTLLESIIFLGLMTLTFGFMASGVIKAKADVEQKIQIVKEQTEEHERLLKGVLEYVEYYEE